MALFCGTEQSMLEDLLDPVALFQPVREESGAVLGFLLTYANRAACDEAWVNPDSLVGGPLSQVIPGLEEAHLLPDLLQALEGEPLRRDAVLVTAHHGGSPLDRILALRAFRVGDHLALTWRDVTALRRSRQVVAELTRVRRVLQASSRAMIRLRKRELLLDEICRIAVEEGSLRMAWAGLLDPQKGMVRPVASRGIVQGYLEGLEISVLDVPEGHGPTGSAIRSGRTVACNDLARDPRFEPWRQRALDRGFRSSASLPLHSDSRTIGALSLYSAHPDAFGREELEVLEAMAEDLSFALRALEIEEARRQADRILLEREAHIRALNEELEERVRQRTAELEAFTYSVSHDLRSPLQGIIGYADLLTVDYADSLDADAVRMLKNIDKAASHMCDLMEDLLLFSRFGRACLEVEDLDLTGLAREIALEVRSAQPRDRDLEFHVGDLGRARWDPRLMRQVLVNLFQNAARYTRRDAPARVEVSRSGDRVLVRDNGPGFPPEMGQKLFEPFVRLEPSIPGTGLGLAIVQRAVDRHSGEAGAEGRPGEGATFWFTLEPRASEG